MQQISPEHALSAIRSSLSLTVPVTGDPIDDTLLVQLLRAAALAYCPCTALILKREVARGLHGLADESILNPRLDALLDQLVEIGDLMEPGGVSQVKELPPNVLFAAPLSFAMLSPQTALLFGLSFDDDVVSTRSLLGRMSISGVSRRLDASIGEELPAKFRAAGLRELSIAAWLKEPKKCTPDELVELHARQLRRASPSESVIDDLKIFDSTTKAIYSRCWVNPVVRTGKFIARRPKAFGSNLWMVVQLEKGKVLQTQTLPSEGIGLRGCDEAWRLQLAMDAIAGVRQKYRLSRNGEHALIEFLFPLPLWAARRMHVVGRSVPRVHGIFSFEVHQAVLTETLRFLEDDVWMGRDNG